MSKAHISQYEKMTQTPIPKLLLSLAGPAVVSMLVTTIYNMVDTAFVGKLGNSASGAVGVVFGVSAVLQAIAFMFGQGGGSLMARRLGKKDQENANIYVSTAFFLAIFSAAILALLGLIFLPQLVTFLGSTPTIKPYAEDYCFWILLAAPFIVGSHVMNNLLRFEGKALLSMFALLFGAILNIVLDPILIFVCHLEIAGAGMATAFSQFVGFLLLFSIYKQGKADTVISYRYVVWDLHRIIDMIFTGFPSLIRQGLNSCCTIFLNSTLRIYGDAAIAAMSVVSRISFFLYSACLGIGQGMQPTTSFNYGAQKYDRVRKAYIYTLFYAFASMLVFGTLFLIFSDKMISLFRDDSTVVEIGSRALVLQCIAAYFQPISMTTETLLQSAGRKWESSVLSACRSGLFFLPLLHILSLTRGIYGIQEAQPLAYVLSVFISIPLAFRFFKEMLQMDRNL